jgi:hypothetical protein
MHLWSLAKVFHTCGKTCGKSLESPYGLDLRPETGWLTVKYPDRRLTEKIDRKHRVD